MTAEKERTDSEEQAAAQLESIKGMVAALECDYERLEELREERAALDDERDWPDAQELAELEEAAGEFTSSDEARDRIQEDPLSVQVRGGWHDPGAEDEGPEEYEILLCTGGPACRIIGRLDRHNEPDTARLQHQDWGTPWTELITTGADHDALLTYAHAFYFGS
jgi:hypothetical protein